MPNTVRFWDAWAPHLSHLENNHLDIQTINILLKGISGSVLVVGGGQGLLVDELRKKGLIADGVDSSAEMVKLAKQRRAIDLLHTNGRYLPLADASYGTSIIATGVVDFLNDEKEIRCIMEEAIRVTQQGGRLIVSFYKVHPVAENFLRRIGIITENGVMRHRKLFEMSRLEPSALVSLIRQQANVGLCGAIFELAKLQLFLPQKERILSQNLSMILKSSDNAEELIEAVSESIPYHNPESISALFKKLNLPIDGVMVFDTCFIVNVVLNG
ncbi:MAG: class I SAM-dependent methyltransferase [Candidatus Methylumidiphilus sp.]